MLDEERMSGQGITIGINTEPERKDTMPDAREIMDVYTGSDESEQFDMWFSNRELRTQFDAVDHLAKKREKGLQPESTDTPSRGVQRLWNRLTKCCPWPGHIRGEGAKS
jgi:hypothetical protein